MDLEISKDIYTNNIVEGTNNKKVHYLLSKLYNTDKSCFYKRPDGYVVIENTHIKKLITDLESLKSIR